MRADDAPFRCDWWGTALEHVGLGALRPYLGTYGRYDHKDLPPVPVELKGDLAWLEALPEQEEHLGQWLDENDPGKNERAAAALPRAARKLKLALPPAFARFIADPSLPRRLRSCTGCFYDLGSAP